MVTIRKANAGDKSFVYATWLRGLYHGSPYWGCTTAKAFYSKMSLEITNRLMDVHTEVWVATEADDPDLILGYVVLGSGCLHWIYVKAEGRQRGLARKLLEGKHIEYVTCLTTVGDSIRRKRKWDFYPWGN